MRSDRTRRSTGGGAEHVLAANVDIAVIVASAASPAFHSRLVDRYLVMCQFGDVSPLLCLNKVDLADTLPDLSIYRDLGIPVVLASAAAGYGIAEMGEHLAGKTAVLTGHSGVGKSSLVNRLLGEDRERVGAVGGGGRGRHTTVASTLHVLERSTFVIDTPGIRSLGLWKIGRDELRYYFPEFANHADDCRFRDCLHRSEPGCAVIAAVARGELPTARYDSYLRLLSE
jgi:ribosome biogenesis GTPase